MSSREPPSESHQCPRCSFRVEVPNDLAESLKAQNRYLDHLAIHFRRPPAKHQNKTPGPRAIADQGTSQLEIMTPWRQRGPSNRSKRSDG